MEITMKRHVPLALAFVSAAFATGSAFAANDMLEHAQKVLDGASTSISQAISTAEGKVGGKTLSARLARRHGEDFYDVRVLKDDKLTDVHVSVADGKILEEQPVEPHHTGHMKSSPAKSEQPADKS
jgi:hypothetical protein